MRRVRKYACRDVVLRFMVWGLGFELWDFRVLVLSFAFRVQGSGRVVQGFGLRV